MPTSPPPAPPQTPSSSRTPATPSSSRSRTPAHSRTPSTPIPQRNGLLSPPRLLSPPINRPGSASSFSTINSGSATPTTRPPTPTPPSVIIAGISTLQNSIRAILDAAISRRSGESENPTTNNNDAPVTTTTTNEGGVTLPIRVISGKRTAWEIPTVAWNKLTTPLINIDHRITSIVKPFAHFLQVVERHEGTGGVKVEVLEKMYPKSLSKRNRRRLLLQLENTFYPLNRVLKRRLPIAGDYLRGFIPEGDEDEDESVTMQKVRELSAVFDDAAEEVVAFCQSDSVQRVIDIMNTAAEDNKPLLSPTDPPADSDADGEKNAPGEETTDQPADPDSSPYTLTPRTSSPPSPAVRDRYKPTLPRLPDSVPGTDKPAKFLLHWCAPDDFLRMHSAVRSGVKPEYTDKTAQWFLENEDVKSWLNPESKSDVLIVQGGEFTGKTTLSVRLYDHLRDTSPGGTRTVYTVCHDFDRRYWGRLADGSAVGNILGQVARQLVEEDPGELCRYVGDVVELNPRLGNPIEAMRGRGKDVMQGLLEDVVKCLGKEGIVEDVQEDKTPVPEQEENKDVDETVTERKERKRKAVSVINIVMIIRPSSKATVLKGAVDSLLKLATEETQIRICIFGPLPTVYRPEQLFAGFSPEWTRIVVRPEKKELMYSTMYMSEWLEDPVHGGNATRVNHWFGPLSKTSIVYIGKTKDGKAHARYTDSGVVPAIVNENEEVITYEARPRCELEDPEKATHLITVTKDDLLIDSTDRWVRFYNTVIAQETTSYFHAFLQVQYFLATGCMPPRELEELLDWTWDDYVSSLQPNQRDAAADILLWVVQKCIMKEVPDQGLPDILSRTTGSHLSEEERWKTAEGFYKRFYPSRASSYSSVQCILVHFARRVLGVTNEEVCHRLTDRSITYGIETAESCKFSSYDLFVSGRVRPAIAVTDTIVGDVLLDSLDAAIPCFGPDDETQLRGLRALWSRLEDNRGAFEYYIWAQGEWQERFVVGGVRAKLLHLASRNGNENIVRLILREGDVDAKSGNDWTALHLAAEMGHDRIVEMLLDAGADFELNTGGRIMKNTGAYGQTSSTLAAVEGHDKVVKLLIEAHVNKVKELDEAEEKEAKLIKSTTTKSSDDKADTVEDEANAPGGADSTASSGPPTDTVRFDPASAEAIEAPKPEETPKESRWKTLFAENRVIMWSGAVNGRENILLNLFHDLATRKLIDAKFTRVSAFLGAVRYGHYKLVTLLLSWDPRMAHTPFQQWEGTTCLHLAVSHPRVLQYLLKNGARGVVNTADNTGRTPLDQAIKAEMERSVELLLDAGADVRCANHQGQSSALTLAARSGYEPVLRILLERCADDFKRYSNDKRGPIHMSAFSGCTKAIEMLVEYGFDPTVKDESGCYAPEAAALGGSVEALKFLWDKKLCSKEPNARYQPGNTTLLHLAVENGNSNPDMIKFLLANGADINVADDNGRTPLHAAVLRDDLSIAELLMRKGAKADIGEKPALCVAAALGKGDMVHLMLRMGSNIDCTDCQGSTAISLAGMGVKGSPHIVRELIDAGADLEKTDHLGRTPLNYFCSVGLVAIECVVALLEAGADTGALDHNENSPLHRAVSAGGLPLVQLLLKHGADPNIITLTDQYTPLHVAARNGQLSCVLALLHAGAKVDAITKNLREAPLHPASFGGHADIVRVLLSNGADPNRRCHNDYRSGPLHDAALKGHARVVEELLDGGADVGMYSKHSTALHYATRHAEVVRVLLDRGADVHARETDEDGDTVLHVAVIRADDPGILRMLVAAGADVEARNSNGETPLMLAVRVGQEMPARVLLELGADVDAREGGTTAMMLAVRKNDRRMVRLLRRWGARGA